VFPYLFLRSSPIPPFPYSCESVFPLSRLVGTKPQMVLFFVFQSRVRIVKQTIKRSLGPGPPTPSLFPSLPPHELEEISRLTIFSRGGELFSDFLTPLSVDVFSPGPSPQRAMRPLAHSS